MDIERVPYYNIPDLAGFKLKPYVAHSTPKVSDDIKVPRKVHLDEETLKDIETQIKNAP